MVANTMNTNGKRAAEDVGQLHPRRRDALEIERRHRDRRRVERGLRVQRHQDAEEDRVDLEVVEQRQEDRHEDDDDLGPFQRPAEQEDDDLGQQQEAGRRQIEREEEGLDHLLAAEHREHGRERPRADEQVADHRGRARGEVDRVAQHGEVERPVGGGEDHAGERAGARGLGRRRETEQDRAEHRDDQQREREERRRERPHHLAERNVGLFRRQLGRKRRIDHRARDDVDDVEAGEQEARNEGGGIELDRRHAGGRRVDDQQDARRNQDAEAAARADHAGGELHVVTGAQHRRECQQSHQRDDGADDAGRGREHRAGEQRRHRERAGHVLHRELQRIEQPVENVRALDHVAHEEE